MGCTLTVADRSFVCSAIFGAASFACGDHWIDRVACIALALAWFLLYWAQRRAA